MESLLCEFCKTSEATKEGFFYSSAKFNPYAKGTASAGLKQRRVACNECVDEYFKALQKVEAENA